VAGSAARQGRVRARRCAVQALYQWQVSERKSIDIIDEFIEIRELARVDKQYFATLVSEVVAGVLELKSDLRDCLDIEWDRLDLVEKSVLLVSAYEMKECIDIPYQVVINEGVELCKMFGTVEGFRFVNAALDRLARSQRALEIASQEA
jgi:N utilization substance protein B